MALDRILGSADVAREVSGQDRPFLQCVADGEIDKPELQDHRAWVTWRSIRASKTRPRKAVDGYTTTPAQESALWKGVMKSLYGESWRDDLDTKMAETAAAVEAEQGDLGEEDPEEECPSP